MIYFLYNNMEHKLFIILYSILIIYGFYLVLKEKSDIERNIKEKSSVFLRDRTFFFKNCERLLLFFYLCIV